MSQRKPRRPHPGTTWGLEKFHVQFSDNVPTPGSHSKSPLSPPLGLVHIETKLKNVKL